MLAYKTELDGFQVVQKVVHLDIMVNVCDQYEQSMYSLGYVIHSICINIKTAINNKINFVNWGACDLISAIPSSLFILP